MSISQAKQSNLIFISTFLSHSSADKPLVEAVAKQLGRRGVLPWLDKNELAMGSLSAALKQAVQQQSTLTIFLSHKSIESNWCRDELLYALEIAENYEHFLPVYIGDPLELVSQHDLLQSRFLHADGDRVDQLGIYDSDNPLNPDPSLIAEQLALAMYEQSDLGASSEVVIILDQRGDGIRRGYPPSIPANVKNLTAPTLTFRPNIDKRQRQDLLVGHEWEDVVNTMTSALSTALGTIRGDSRKVRVLGNAQTGIMWAIGQHFNRTTSADLYTYGQNAIPLTNRGQVRHTSLIGGDPNSAILLFEELENLGERYSEIALGIGNAEKFKDDVRKAVPEVPLFWIESGFIKDSPKAMALVANLVASVENIRKKYGTRELLVFWTTANHVAALAAANLTTHVIPKIKYMEWDHGRAEYVHLPMPE